MRTTPAMRDLERRHGKPIRQLLSDAYNEKGTLRGAAESLEIDYSTVSHWMARLGIDIRASKEAVAS